MNMFITGKGSRLKWSATVFSSYVTLIGSGHQSRKNLQISTASRNDQTTGCHQPKVPGSNRAITATIRVNTNGLTLPYRTQAERLAGPLLQATRRTHELNVNSNTNTRQELITTSPETLQTTQEQQSKTRTQSQQSIQQSDTTIRNSNRSSKSKGLIQVIHKALKTVWRASLSCDEHGENFWHLIVLAAAFSVFICCMLWVMGETPTPYELINHQSHDVITIDDTSLVGYEHE